MPSNDVAGALNIESFYLRNDTNAPGDIIFDELRLGTSFGDVSVVPEPATAGVLALVGGMLAMRPRVGVNRVRSDRWSAVDGGGSRALRG